MKQPIDDLDLMAATVTGRSESIFDRAFASTSEALRSSVEDKTILLTGGAGFIATQTLMQLLEFRPRTVVIADSSENAMAELVRLLRSSGLVPSQTALEPRLVDITSPLAQRMLDEFGPIDLSLQFAAAKHVRSERDIVSLLRMIHVNLNGTYSFTKALVDRNPEVGVFVVSTDKAADPSSLMGASKRLMEMAVQGAFPQVTTTRFANVAFSSGSLLESWLIRLRQGQPLAVPADTWRYFVSPREAGQLCAIASVAPAGTIAVPDEESAGLVELQQALSRVLQMQGLAPEWVEEEQALSATDVGSQRVPVVVTIRDTPGEKMTEKFVAVSEERREWLPRIGLVKAQNIPGPALGFADWIQECVDQPRMPVTLSDVIARVGDVVQEFAHIAGDRRLDDRI